MTMQCTERIIRVGREAEGHTISLSLGGGLFVVFLSRPMPIVIKSRFYCYEREEEPQLCPVSQNHTFYKLLPCPNLHTFYSKLKHCAFSKGEKLQSLHHFGNPFMHLPALTLSFLRCRDQSCVQYTNCGQTIDMYKIVMTLAVLFSISSPNTDLALFAAVTPWVNIFIELSVMTSNFLSWSAIASWDPIGVNVKLVQKGGFICSKINPSP